MGKSTRYLLFFLILGFTETYSVRGSLKNAFSTYERNMDDALRAVRNTRSVEFFQNVTRETKNILNTLEIIPRKNKDDLKNYKESQKGK